MSKDAFHYHRNQSSVQSSVPKSRDTEHTRSQTGRTPVSGVRVKGEASSGGPKLSRENKSFSGETRVPQGESYGVKSSSTLIQFLSEKLGQKSRSAIKNMIQHQCVWVNDVPVTKATYMLSPGDMVKTVSPKQQRFGFHHPKLSIIYEDEAIIVVNKASGLHSVDSTDGGVENAASILEAYLRRKNPEKRIYVVHRLDRDTSGVMIFAKTRVAQDRLVKTWNESVLERKYIAIAEGCMSASSGTLDSYLYEDSRKVMQVTDDSSRGLRAITHYQVLCKNEKYTKVALELETGRTNQIRVHLQSMGHPVAGDLKYRAQTNPIGRLALHALNIRFRHPITQRVMVLSAAEPESFERLIKPFNQDSFDSDEFMHEIMLK